MGVGAGLKPKEKQISYGLGGVAPALSSLRDKSG